jgi:hypothetical protein
MPANPIHRQRRRRPREPAAADGGDVLPAILVSPVVGSNMGAAPDGHDGPGPSVVQPQATDRQAR